MSFSSHIYILNESRSRTRLKTLHTSEMLWQRNMMFLFNIPKHAHKQQLYAHIHNWNTIKTVRPIDEHHTNKWRVFKPSSNALSKHLKNLLYQRVKSINVLWENFSMLHGRISDNGRNFRGISGGWEKGAYFIMQARAVLRLITWHAFSAVDQHNPWVIGNDEFLLCSLITLGSTDPVGFDYSGLHRSCLMGRLGVQLF